jgi:hypothetical protein
MTKALTVDINEFITEHGKPPRGYGNWLFGYRMDGQSSNARDALEFGASGTFTEAKRQLVAHVAAGMPDATDEHGLWRVLP